MSKQHPPRPIVRVIWRWAQRNGKFSLAWGFTSRRACAEWHARRGMHEPKDGRPERFEDRWVPRSARKGKK